MKSVWAIPSEARLNNEQIGQLAGLLEMDAKELAQKLASDKTFVFLRRQLPPDIGERVAALKLPGIGQDKEYRRFYPSGEMTAHMVGFTGVDDKGLEGVELAFQRQLLGHAGSRSVIKDRRGQIVEDVGSIKPPQDGKDIRLAIDSKVQYLAYSQLKQAVTDFKAKAGGVVVVDTKTGEILALANWPTYNPNNRERLSGAQLRNRALTDTYRAGFGDEAVYRRAGAGIQQGAFRHGDRCARRDADDRLGDDFRRAPARRSDRRPGHPEVVQRRHGEDRRDAVARADVDDVRRHWPRAAAGSGLPRRSDRALAAVEELAADRAGDDVLRPRLSVSLMQLARAYTVFAREGDMVPLSLTKTDGMPVRRSRSSASRRRAKCGPCLKWPRSPAVRRRRRRFPAIASAARPAPRTRSKAVSTSGNTSRRSSASRRCPIRASWLP
jgi:cell division protein FtsI (penicillin-binding protein 3)